MTNKEQAYKKISVIKKQVSANNFLISRVEERQYNYEISASKKNTKIKVQVYFGKKGVKTVLQGNATSPEYVELNGIISGNLSLPFKKIPEKTYTSYIGTDETGKGDYFGPLVVAGFFVNKEIQEELEHLGIRDSKELSDPQINRIAKEVISEFPDNYSVISFAPEKYNEIYVKFNNVNKLLNWAHSKVVENLLEKNIVKVVITDQFSKESLAISVQPKYKDVDFLQMPKAEKYFGVAAASIIARYNMNMWFEKKQFEGFNVLKGASSEVEFAAKHIMNENGKEILHKLVKLHFKTTQKIFED